MHMRVRPSPSPWGPRVDAPRRIARPVNASRHHRRNPHVNTVQGTMHRAWHALEPLTHGIMGANTQGAEAPTLRRKAHCVIEQFAAQTTLWDTVLQSGSPDCAMSAELAPPPESAPTRQELIGPLDSL